MRRILAAMLAVVAVATAAGCGNDDETSAAPLQRVPEGLVPEAVAEGTLRFYRNEDKAKKAFADAGPNALMADAELWELRDGERLVGALQLTTVVPDVDLRKSGDRDEILGPIMPGSASRLDIGETPVWLTASEDKVVYAWFARTMFQILQLKGSRLDAEAVVTELVRFQTASRVWDPIPYEDYERSG